MIDIKELRIGSYIGYYKNGFENIIYDTIKSIYFNDEDEAYHFEFDKPNFVHYHLAKQGIVPIPITEDLLYKIGFKKTHVDVDVYEMDISSFHISIAKFEDATGRDFHMNIYDNYIEMIIGADLQYVHQLQNAIYFATNINVGF